MSPEYLNAPYDDVTSGRKIPVLVSMEPFFLRDSVITMLQSFRFVLLVGEGSGPAGWCITHCQPQPQIVLIDCSQFNTGWADSLKELRASRPEIKCLAVADTFQAGKLALKNGADEVILHGFTSHDLEKGIQRLAPLPVECQNRATVKKG